MNHCVLIGCPGSGKGTLSKIFISYGYFGIGIGDILRRKSKEPSLIGKLIKQHVDTGILLPDEIICQIVFKEIQKVIRKNRKFVLEGFPNTLFQFFAFKKFLGDTNNEINKSLELNFKNVHNINYVFLKISEELVLDRIKNRMICSSCYATYNTKYSPSLQEDICDFCQKLLIYRSEDSEILAKQRIKQFQIKTQPIVDWLNHFESQSLIIVEGNMSKMLNYQDKIRKEIQSGALPSYIYTYPPKSAYEPYDDWKETISHWKPVQGEINLYIHIPFCEMKCYFCDLFTVTNVHKEEIVKRYVDCILKELEIMLPYLNIENTLITSLYFGGGTPSLLPFEKLQLLLTTFKRNFKFKDNAEISIEGAPNTFNESKLQELKKLGFNRVSIGVQTFDQDQLKSLGRHYEAKLGYKAAKMAAKEFGFENVNIDLIYGLPGQTLEQWVHNLETAIETGINTITVYPLVLRKRTLFGKQKRNLLKDNDVFVEERKRYAWYDKTIEILNKAGFEQNSFVSFSKRGGGCQYEEGSFLGAPTLAFGAGARKYAPSIHYVDDNYTERKPNKTIFLDYMKSIEELSIIPVRSAVRLSKEEQMRRFFILGLLSSGVSKQRFTELFQENVFEIYFDIILALEREELIKKNENDQEKGSKIVFTSKGYKYSSIIGQFLSTDAIKETFNRYG